MVLRKVGDATSTVACLDLKDPPAEPFLVNLEHEQVFEQPKVWHDAVGGIDGGKKAIVR